MLFLNDDVVLMIVDNMSSEESKNALCALSQTSRRFRDLCVPVLRSTARLDSVRCPSRISRQIPEWMRPYLRYEAYHFNTIYTPVTALRELTLRDICGDRTSRYREYPWSRDPIMCSTYEGDAIAALLPSIPHLRKVVLISSHDPPPRVSFVYGISWEVVKAITSARGLQELNLDGHFFCLDTFAPDPDFTPAPLTTFRCTIPHRRLVPVTRAFSTETEALTFVLERLRHSLEHLSLTTETAPLDMIRDADWPRLRSLHLAGDILPATHSLPWVSVLRHMPRLRVLSLRAAVPDDIDNLTTHQIVWPRDTLLDILPWPELEDLEVTYPDPEDRLFSHLPSTLRSLSIGRFAFFHSAPASGGRGLRVIRDRRTSQSTRRVPSAIRHAGTIGVIQRFLRVSASVGGTKGSTGSTHGMVGAGCSYVDALSDSCARQLPALVSYMSLGVCTLACTGYICFVLAHLALRPHDLLLPRKTSHRAAKGSRHAHRHPRLLARLRTPPRPRLDRSDS